MCSVLLINAHVISTTPYMVPKGIQKDLKTMPSMDLEMDPRFSEILEILEIPEIRKSRVSISEGTRILTPFGPPFGGLMRVYPS